MPPTDLTPPPSQAALAASAEKLCSLLGQRPQVALVLGSGLSKVAANLGLEDLASYTDLGLPVPGVAGHAGVIAGGNAGPWALLAFAGRAHLYEGHTLEASTRAIRLALTAGARIIILTNAAGGLAEHLSVGDIMALRDHLSLPGLCGYASAANASGYPWPFFVSQDQVYASDLRLAAVSTASDLGFVLHEGVYAMVWGPLFESPAERRLLCLLGADAVGMSTVPEAVAAHAAGASVLALSVITNVAASPEPPTHADVTRITSIASERLASLIRALLLRVASD